MIGSSQFLFATMGQKKKKKSPSKPNPDRVPILGRQSTVDFWVFLCHYKQKLNLQLYSLKIVLDKLQTDGLSAG